VGRPTAQYEILGSVGTGQADRLIERTTIVSGRVRTRLRSLRLLAPLEPAAMRLRASWEASRAFSDPSTPPILVYQMGKVGSWTVHDAIKRSGISSRVLHVHYLSDDLPRHREAHERAGMPAPYYHVFLGEAVRRVLSRQPGGPCKIISLVRDPIAFVVSDLFQNPYFAREIVQNEDGTIDPERAASYLVRSLSRPTDFHKLQYVNSWFDRELKQIFGIDVFAEPFPSEQGYAIYSHGNVSALVIRLEDLSRMGPSALGSFLGLQRPVSIRKRNTRESSYDGNTYQKVLNKIALDSSTCHEIYSSRLVRHFYSESMIRDFIAKWTSPEPRLV
jgi:hypothetical protein